MVVCGTDFSPQAQEAARVAARLAAALSEPLLLAHVVDELGAEIVLGSRDDRVYDDLRDQLDVEARRLQETGAVVEVRLEGGVPGDRLAALAARVRARLVVIGAGVRRVGSIRLGSTAVRLVRRSGTPLLLLRTFAPFHAWLDGQRPLRVLVGDDLEDVGAVALSWLPTLAELGPLEVTALHISTVEPGASGAIAEQLRSRARAMAHVEAAPRVIAAAGSAAGALAQTSGHLDPDLVLVGTSQRGWVSRWLKPSVAAGVVDLTTTSVVVVVPGATSDRRAPARFGRLVALADPSTADAVLAHAVGLGMPSCTVHLLTAPEPDDVAGDWPARLEGLARRYTDGSDVVVEVRVIEGPADALAREAERLGADACVVPEALAARLLGTVGRPVLVVPAAARGPEVRRG